MKVLRSIGLAAAACMALAGAACGGSTSPSAGTGQHYARGGTFTVALATDPGNLDPQQSVLAATGAVDSYLYDSLIYENEHGKIESELASRWQVSPSSVTFTLRKDVTCSDGSRLTAEDVARNFEYLKDPKNASPLIGVDLPNNDFTVSADNATGTFTITMAKPFGFLLLGAGSIPIVCPSGMANRSLLAHGSEGTGPFVLTQALPGDQYTLRRRSDYRWGPDGAGTDILGFPDRVVIKIIQNYTTAANLLLSGGLNAAAIVGPDEQRLNAAHLFKVTLPELVFQLFYNEAAGHPGADERVRQALTMDLNLGQLARVATAGLGGPATGLAVSQPQACPGNTVAGSLPRYDPTVAARLLDQAGWTMGSDGIRTKDGKPLAITLLEPADAGDQVAAALELIAQDWKKLGVQVAIKPETDVALTQVIFGTGAWDASEVPVNSNLPSVIQGFVSGTPPPQGTNFAHIDNPTYNQLSARALATPGAAGCSLWERAEKALYKRADVIPVANLPVPVYGQKVHFDPGPYGVEPTSIQLLA